MTTDLSFGLGTTSQTSFFIIASYSSCIASFQTWCLMASSKDPGSDCTIVLMAARYPWYLHGFLLSRNVPLGAAWPSASSRVSLSHDGLFPREGEGSIGSIGPSTSGIVSSWGSSRFPGLSSWFSSDLGRSTTFFREASSSKVTSWLISTSLWPGT